MGDPSAEAAIFNRLVRGNFGPRIVEMRQVWQVL